MSLKNAKVFKKHLLAETTVFVYNVLHFNNIHPIF